MVNAPENWNFDTASIFQKSSQLVADHKKIADFISASIVEVETSTIFRVKQWDQLNIVNINMQLKYSVFNKYRSFTW